MEKDCLFCSIVNKQIPTDFLYVNDQVVVFRDINPSAPVHLLIVPRKHIRSINDVTDDDLNIISNMIVTAKQMAENEAVATTGYKLFFNVEKGGGQVIFHLHLHLVGGWK